MAPYYDRDGVTLHHSDCLAAMRAMPEASVDAVVTDPPAGISFLGREWDRDKGGRAEWVAWLTGVMVEALRVTVPGGHALVWALPRTSHWTATAMEDAGWQIRDVIVHLFGSGFPKSKSLLKPAAEHWVLARKPGPLRELGIDATRISAPGGLTSGGEWHKREGDDWHMGPRRADEHPAGRWPSNVVLSHIQPAPDGHGGCRRVGTRRVRGGNDPRKATEEVEAWLCAEGCPVDALDRQAGERTGDRPNRKPRRNTTALGLMNDDACRPKPTETAGYEDGSNVSRFFPTFGDAGEATRFRYVAKASRAERTLGLEGHPLYGMAEDEIGAAHPTVKPLELCSWLVRLVTPPGGLVLDCFMGSGSVGCAAARQGFRFIGIEQDVSYCEIARRRIEHWSGASLPLFRRET